VSRHCGPSAQASAEAREIGGERALHRAFAHVRIPAAHVDESQSVVVAQQPASTLGLELESLRVDRAAVRVAHLVGHGLSHLLAQVEAAGDGGLQVMTAVQVDENRRLALIEGRLADAFERDVRHGSGALEHERQ